MGCHHRRFLERQLRLAVVTFGESDQELGAGLETGLIPEFSISFKLYYHGLLFLLCFSRSSFFN